MNKLRAAARPAQPPLGAWFGHSRSNIVKCGDGTRPAANSATAPCKHFPCHPPIADGESRNADPRSSRALTPCTCASSTPVLHHARGTSHPTAVSTTGRPPRPRTKDRRFTPIPYALVYRAIDNRTPRTRRADSPRIEAANHRATGGSENSKVACNSSTVSTAANCL